MPEADGLRVLLVDDEPGGLTSLRTALAPMPEVTVVGECDSVPSAVEAIRGLEPDLVFLDIRLGSDSGMRLGEYFEADEMPQVVFVTAYAEHAVDAFDLNAVDYVLKPFQDARLARAVRRAVRRARKPQDALPAQGSRGGAERIMVRKDHAIRFVKVEHVVRLEADGNYVAVVTDGDSFPVRSTLKDLLGRLDPSMFVRVHRSHAVNLDRVREIQPWFGGEYLVILDNDEEVRLSRSFRESVLQAFR